MKEVERPADPKEGAQMEAPQDPRETLNPIEEGLYHKYVDTQEEFYIQARGRETMELEEVALE